MRTIVIPSKNNSGSTDLEGKLNEHIGDSLKHKVAVDCIQGGSYSNAEGYNTIASTGSTHAEGSGTVAITGSAYPVVSVNDSTKTLTLERADSSTLKVGTNIVVFISTSMDTEKSFVTASIVSISGVNVTIDTNETITSSWSYLIVPSTSAKDKTSAHAEGSNTLAHGANAHAEGCRTVAEGNCSHAEGYNTKAKGINSHTEGSATTASGFSSHAEGSGTVASGYTSHAEGDGTVAKGSASHAEGYNTIAESDYSHAEGNGTTAKGNNSHAEGYKTVASGSSSHAEGSVTTASGIYSHAEGSNTKASNTSAHAEGYRTTASGSYSHAEGYSTIAEGSSSHAEGNGTTANGIYSHAEGNGTTAKGTNSHAEGYLSESRGAYSHAGGYYSVANAYASRVIGRYNKELNGSPNSYSSSGDAFVIGNGSNNGVRSNAFRVACNGQVYMEGTVNPGGADYAEYFEWLDGNEKNEDRVGYFVTLDGEKIRKATSEDEYILGVISVNPSIVGDSCSEDWHGKYERDEWGRVQHHYVDVEAEYDEDGNEIAPVRQDYVPVLSRLWDSREKYTPRAERIEWSPVGMVGKLLVRDDGTCKVNGYCKPNDQGVATSSETGYRVMKRVADNIVLVLIK